MESRYCGRGSGLRSPLHIVSPAFYQAFPYETLFGVEEVNSWEMKLNECCSVAVDALAREFVSGGNCYSDFEVGRNPTIRDVIMTKIDKENRWKQKYSPLD